MVWAAGASATTYYVNDSRTNGDVYTTSVGSDGNSGLTNSAPKLSITNLLTTYFISTGDVVYIDTGVYSNYTVTITNQGNGVTPVVFQGSTNFAAGGSVIDRRNGSAQVLLLDSAHSVQINDITCRGGSIGVYLFATTNAELSRVYSVSNGTGFLFQNSVNDRVRNSVAARNSVGIQGTGLGPVFWEQGVLWSNTTAMTLTSILSFSNSVMVGGTMVSAQYPASMDYNVFWSINLGLGLDFLSELSASRTNSFFSTWGDPLFADPAGLDFHPRSLVGRFNPNTGFFVTDTVHSVVIDLGDPARPFASEPSPNGSNVNVGVFGNTTEASMSRTNGPWLYAISHNDGGELTGTGTLRWTYGNMTNGTTVAVQYTPGAGSVWSNLATGLPITNRSYTWVATGAVANIGAFWRVVQESNTNIWDASDTNFVLRPSATNTFALYVNDGVTAGDNYCTAAGSATNSGVSPSAPRHSLQGILDSYDVGPDDVVYVDAGVYTGAVTLATSDRGNTNRFLRITGSTNNIVESGTVLDVNSNLLDGITIPSGSRWIRFSNFAVRRSRYAINAGTSSDCEFNRVAVYNNLSGFRGTPASSFRFTGCLAASNAVGVELTSGSSNTWDQGTLWSNVVAFSLGTPTAISISNSIIMGLTAFATAAPTNQDYNLFAVGAMGVSLQSLYEYQKSRSGGWHSTAGDPLFADPTNLDFHTRSVMGRFNPVTGAWVTDAQHSVSIDIGDPARVAAATNEPAPNGGRINAGAFSGTAQASMSRTSLWVQALSLQDGGQFSVGDTLYWNASGLPTGATVRIEYSGDSGGSWATVTSNLVASLGSYQWVSTNFASSLFGRWRVVYESNPSVLDASRVNFILRNGRFEYYVNDDTLTGDMYCTAIGSDTNTGSTGANPKRTLTNLFAVVDLDAGDVVYIDTGVHRSTAVPQITGADSGVSTNPVLIIGSTNVAAGGTVLDRLSGSPTSHGLHFNGATYVTVQNIGVSNAGTGFRLDGSVGIRLADVSARNCSESGVRSVNSSGVEMERAAFFLNGTNGVFVDSGTGIVVRDSVLWGNGQSALRVDAGRVVVSGSVLVVSSPGATCYRVATPTNVVAGYNCVVAESNQPVAVIANALDPVDTLSAWVYHTGQDAQSLSVDPMFADPSRGDFHPMTQTVEGRYNPALGLWVSDDATSPLIDSGAPSGAYSNEPAYNGGRVNLGNFANTPEASKGRADPWLMAASLQAGGWIRGTATLAWVAGNMPTLATARVEFSPDGGESWSVLTNGISMAAQSFVWNATAVTTTPAGVWRVVSLVDTTLQDQTRAFFAVRATNLTLYLNDSETAGDIYASGAGSATNWQATAARPFRSLADAMQLYDLEPGDVIYVDTGTYASPTSSILVTRMDSGTSQAWIRVVGSTNEVAGGSVLDRQASDAEVLRLKDARWVSVSNLTFRGGSDGVQAFQSSDLQLAVRVQNNSAAGFNVFRSTNVVLDHAVSAYNAGRGITAVSSQWVSVHNAIVWSNTAGAFYVDLASVSVSNSVLLAHGAGKYVYEVVSTVAVLNADCNDVLAHGGAQVALIASRAYKTLANLQSSFPLELRALSHDPLFANLDLGDFHLRSSAGRYDPSSGVVFDGLTSPLIDSGARGYPYANEPSPNGQRVNIGLYGNTAVASRSPTSGWFVATKMNDGGGLRGTGTLYWVAGGVATGHLVSLDFSGDGGITWTNIASNIAASAESYALWDTTLNGSTLLGYWRITSQSDPGVFDTNDTAFALNNGPLTYYVNDNSTLDDVYCAAIGDPSNDGYSKFTPLNSVQAVLSSYTLLPGDRILVDSGYYALSSTLTIDQNVIGLATNLIVIQGSTNLTTGGTVFDGPGLETGIELNQCSGVGLNDVRVKNSRVGVFLFRTTNCISERVMVEGAPGYSFGSYGIQVRNSTGPVFRSCAVIAQTNALNFGAAVRVQETTGFQWLNGVLWSNKVGFDLVLSDIAVSNSIFCAYNPNAPTYSVAVGASVRANYNDYFLTNGAVLAQLYTPVVPPSLNHPVIYDTVDLWYRATGQDRHSLSHEPSFVDARGFDFHLRSTAGRVTLGGGLTTDAETSVLLDAGNPASVFTNEPAPNGSRIDLGIYGNSMQASRTPTNGALVAVTLNDGGVASGTNQLLYWLARGAVTTHPLRVEFSPDDGVSWYPVVSNLAAGTRTHVWNTVVWPASVTSAWRVASQTDPSISDRSDQPFLLRNSNLVYYVNDASTQGDVFCTAPGSSFKTGLSPSLPRGTVQEILNAYNLEPGDTVYIDTGVYAPTGVIVVTQQDAGEGTNCVVFQGSTNEYATVFQDRGWYFDAPRAVRLRNIEVDMGSPSRDAGVRVLMGSNVAMERITVRNPGDGIDIRQSFSTLIDRSIVLGASTNGIRDFGSYFTTWENGILWSNAVGVKAEGTALSVSNTILGAVTAVQLPYYVAGGMTSDYNAIYLANGAQAANQTVANRAFPLQYETVGRWAKDTGRDQHTPTVDPLFAAVGSDFHLKSTAGRYDPSVTGFVQDAETSVLLDAGDPTWSYSAETQPNGSRRDLGLYGDTAQASLTPTNASLKVVSFNDGGVASGSSQMLYWLAGGLATAYSVRVDFSVDGGLTWTNLATNVAAGTTSIPWNSTNYLSTPLGRWRVVAENDTNIWDISDAYFALRNGPISFYVNDASTNGDVYCIVAGTATNLGVSPNTPRTSINSILSFFDLEPGDTVYVDTGSYTTQTAISFGQLDVGSAVSGAYVTVQGSTNEIAGGTLIVATTSASIFDLFDANGLWFRDMTLQPLGAGLSIRKSSGIIVERVTTVGGTKGFEASESSDIAFRNCVGRNASSAGLSVSQTAPVQWQSGVLWSNKVGFSASGSSASISNSILGVFGDTSYAYDFDHLSVFTSEYNAVYLSGGGLVARQSLPVGQPFPLEFDSVSRWSRATGRDRFTFSGDPVLANPNEGDFSLRSTAGRYDPLAQAFTNDSITSPLVDAGAPFGAFSNEPAQNGGRINIGPHGNTTRASLSPTNASLVAVSLNDGGRAEGAAWPLYWVARGAATGHTVRVEFGSGTATVWTVVATNIPARVVTPYSWNTTPLTSTVSALWRITDEAEPAVVDTNDRLFAVRNTPLAFYVNDVATNGDVYCSSAGSELNSGTTPSSPLHDLQAVLDRYDLEPGDTVYVDTGNYLLIQRTYRWGRFDAWDAMNSLSTLAAGSSSVTLRGSTNATAGGSVFSAFQTSVALAFTQAMGVVVRDLEVRQLNKGNGTGVDVGQSYYADFTGVRVEDGRIGFLMNDSDGVVMEQCVARNHVDAGLYSFHSDETVWRSGVLWSNKYGVLQNDDDSGDLLVENTAVGALSGGSFAWLRVKGRLTSDYNDIYRASGGFAAGVVESGVLGGGTTRYEKVTSWYSATTNDPHSLASNPQFANAGAADFHPQSPAGRFVVGSGYITNIGDGLSPLVDTGRPTSPFSQEPAPNGARLNIGLHGNTGESSLSPTNGVVVAITLSDGGSAAGDINLRWAAGGVATGHTVRLDFSSDGGASWTNIATNVLASLGTYLWDSVPYGRAAAGLWRVVSEVDPTVFDVTDEYFALRNGGSIPYYVNDLSLAGDVYCTNIGDNANSGYLPGEPKASVQALIDAIDLEPGDVVYVDTGTYLLASEVLVGDLDAGTETNTVVFRGSTNFAVGGSVLDRQVGVGTAVRTYQTVGVEFRDFTVKNAAIGVHLQRSDACRVVGVRSIDHSQVAFLTTESPTSYLVRCVAAFSSNGVEVTSGTISMDGVVVWGNEAPMVMDALSAAYVRNSVIQAAGADSRLWRLNELAGDIDANYNDYVRQENALFLERSKSVGGNEIYARLTDWQVGSGQDVRSLSHDPLYVDASSGNFHPRSAQGRYTDAGVLTNDAPGIYSPLLDTGNPGSVYTNERPPNGSRINIGCYGNTTLASLSQTNPWMLAVSLNDGGTIRGTVDVYWVSGQLPTGATIRLEQALDGVDFTVFASNIPAAQATSRWDVSTADFTAVAKWRVVYEQNPAIYDEVDQPITIKNANLVVFVNDADTSGDVYCSAVGSCTNTGRASDQPLCDPGYALQKYVFGPDDLLYIDTGTYSLTNSDGMVLGLIDGDAETGETNHPIRIIGSTNHLAGGSRVIGTYATNSFGLHIQDTKFVEVQHLRFTGVGNGVYVERALQVAFSNVEVYASQGHGFWTVKSSPVRFTHCSSWNNAGDGLLAGQESSVIWDQGVIWSNGTAAVELSQAFVAASNSILQMAVTNRYIFRLNDPAATIAGDYNFLWTGSGAALGIDSYNQLIYRALAQWQNDKGADEHSVVLDPLMLDPGQGKFHLQSAGGRYDPDADSYVFTDTSTSWALDAADPALGYTNEPAPNGGRRNVGLYGGSTIASMTVTNPAQRALQVVSYNDGGQLVGPEILRWLARAMTTGDLVSIEFSVNNGADWISIASNVPATIREYAWSPVASNSTPVALWRLTLQDDPAVVDTNDRPFRISLLPYTYYVNDTNLAGDVYATAVGISTNDGLAKARPKDSIQGILDAYDLEGGDQILVDTGYYLLPTDTVWLVDDGGALSNRVYLTGSTNLDAGGTVLDRGRSNAYSATVLDSAIQLYRPQYVDISHLTIMGANVGIQGLGVRGAVVSNVVIRDGGRSGMEWTDSQNNSMRRLLITRISGVGLSLGASSGSFDSGVIWSNEREAISLSIASLAVSNSILHAHGTNACYALVPGSTIIGDYNNLFQDHGGPYARVGATALEGLPQWTTFSTQDMFSTVTDPLFADPSSLDFHVASPAGRYDPLVAGFVTTDTVYSYTIDTGSTNSTFSAELDPNGGRRNVGLYGDTSEASKSRTNAWLLALTASSGGRIGGAFFLTWAYGGMDSTNRVSIDFSYDDGTNWVQIASNLVVSSPAYLWDSLLTPGAISPIARWRLSLESNTNVADSTDRAFGLNGPFTFYLNDTNSACDIFTTAWGLDSNLGIYSNAPKRTLRNLIDTWDLEGGDRVVIDTGDYPLMSNDVITIGRSDEGTEAEPITLKGSTNCSGAVLRWAEFDPGPDLLILDASHFIASGLRFERGGVRLQGTNNVFSDLVVSNGNMDIAAERCWVSDTRIYAGLLRTSGSSQEISRVIMQDGLFDLSGSGILMQNSVAYGTQGVAVAISGTNITLRNNTVVSRGTAIRQSGGDSSLILRDNILVADTLTSPTEYIIRRDQGALDSDYNNLVARNGAWFGNANGSWEKLLYWQRASGLDAHSISADPGFANEASSDYHLRSVRGRYTPSGFVTDVTHSSSIDLGSPVSVYTNETAPNGSRVNQGAYGNTVQASRSKTNAWLFAMTMNDGGVLRGTNLIRWAGANLGGGTVTLQYSPDSGTSWVDIVVGVPGADGQYLWNSSSLTSSLYAVWRVVLDSNTNVYDITDTTFALRNTPLGFYVNDTNTSGDVYCVAAGAGTNSGLSADRPRLSISAILNDYDTEGGDTIYVDTGRYSLTTDVEILWSRGGNIDDGPLGIAGSTNAAAGGSVHVRGLLSADADVFDIKASHVAVRDVIAAQGYRGFVFNSNTDVRVERSVALSNEYGVAVLQSMRPIVRNMRLMQNRLGGVDLQESATTVVENITFYGNGAFGIRASQSEPNTFQNNIFGINTTGTVAYAGVLDNTFIDYNIYYFMTNASLASGQNNLLQWQLTTARDYRSAMTNPLFASEATGDLHEKSTIGRWVDGSGWTTDVADSWAIDRGSTNSSYANEPQPNGARINIGAYGNTEYASLGRTSTAVLVEIRTLNDFTIITETNATWPLIWTVINVPTSELFRIEFSGDNGATWYALATNVQAYKEFLVWNSSPFYNTYRGRWRVVGQNNTNYWDINDSPFQLFYGQFKVTGDGVAGLTNYVQWRGAWAENYQVQYTTNARNSAAWFNAATGASPNQVPAFWTTNGGDFLYYDPESTTNRTRLYRILWNQY